MNIKFLDKVCDQIVSETRVKDDLLHTPFYSSFSFSLFSSLLFPLFLSPFSFSSHCKEVYSLNEQEIEYIWKEYKKGVTTLIDKKELSYE